MQLCHLVGNSRHEHTLYLPSRKSKNRQSGSIISHHPLISSHQSSTISDRSSATAHQWALISGHSSVTNQQSSVHSHQSTISNQRGTCEGLNQKILHCSSEIIQVDVFHRLTAVVKACNTVLFEQRLHSLTVCNDVWRRSAVLSLRRRKPI